MTPLPRPASRALRAAALAAALAFAAAPGCESDGEGADASADVGGDAAGDAGDSDTAGGCQGSAPLCATECGSDAFYGVAACEGGDWVCEQGVRADECPAGTCWGAPLPGEICDDGWKCAPGPEIWTACPGLVCATCEGFDGPVTSGGCTCACTGNGVVCSGAACESQEISDLDGVRIAFPDAPCTFTLAEAAAGLSIPWAVVVEAAVPDVVPEPVTTGCQEPGASGLVVGEILEGGDERYCVCDVGPCRAPQHPLRTLQPGTYPGTFTWDGRNWSGPSDTGNPKGAPFPPGTYTLTVRAKGHRVTGTESVPFDIRGELTVTLVP